MIYKIWPLLLLTGCYTVLINPYSSKTEIAKKEKVTYDEQILPIVQKHYVHYPQYYNRHDRNNYPYSYPFYNSSQHYHYEPQVYAIVERSTPISQEKHSTDSNNQKNVEATRERKVNVWQKRINPRNRKPPTPTRRQKDEE